MQYLDAPEEQAEALPFAMPIHRSPSRTDTTTTTGVSVPEAWSPSPWTANDIFASSSSLDADRYAVRTPPRRSGQTLSSDFGPREAQLLRTFVQEWGPLLDCTDAQKHFTNAIPQLALNESECLLYAILTITALYLSRVSQYPSSAAQAYRQKCARALIPILQEDPTNMHEASMFATYVLLRVYDHLTVNFSSERVPDTIFTEGLALSTTPWNAYATQASLKQAAFWVHLRQDIHVALLLECPVNVDYTLYTQTVAVAQTITERGTVDWNADRGHEQDGSAATSAIVVECAWANRIVGIALNVVNYCYSDSEKTVDQWATLLVSLERWNIEKPPSFSPFFECKPATSTGEGFPHIYLMSDWHVIGLMYYHLAIAMLKIHHPARKTNKLGSSKFFLSDDKACFLFPAAEEKDPLI
ncbi:uncharacterized protein PV07_07819 [Cladophialophora immunda]|uniref:Transcription factor domain-containing protein n=1 Tax=Cladophialophora immunda TaxID=569365 RepID=A0A0D2ASL9_9EURO|nr:uncharacterized protein PV07_07819 [Cladophialophora immunda]KIW28137.1 hypothetical protein PV07_07819 [Cladophialophora immunda]